MKIEITTHEAALIYELLHEVKMKCVVGADSSEEDKVVAKRILKDCNGLMRKVEDVVLAPTTNTGKKKGKSNNGK
tara:strand:- start:2914 stop:3138 length:225 start_codon:yes stop_codon:yes gene_type:complete